MKIALLGYGKMGQAVEQDALANGHEIVLQITEHNTADLTIEALQQADVAIEFSTPATVLDHIYLCFDAGVPVVVGTTGWHDKLILVRADCECRNAALFYASNFSIGVNIFFQVNRVLARMMNDFPEYRPSITEVHHTQKLDAPSGTAITLADDIIYALDRKTHWINILKARQPAEPVAASEELEILSERKDDIKGIHTITYQSENDQLVVTHEAFNRKGFAQGAVLAAEWIADKVGTYSMEDLLSFMTPKD